MTEAGPNDANRPTDCQLKVLYNGSEPPARADRLRSWALRLLTALERRITRARARLGQPDHLTLVDTIRAGGDDRPAITNGNGKLQTGELVEVLSLPEIEATLDGNGNCNGLHFMEGMRPLCGRRFTVKKRVRTIFDERAWRMVKVRDTYLLEGAVCDGRGLYDKEGCDRCCFYFFKGPWLRRVNNRITA
jgi:hypothetical protein